MRFRKRNSKDQDAVVESSERRARLSVRSFLRSSSRSSRSPDPQGSIANPEHNTADSDNPARAAAVSIGASVHPLTPSLNVKAVAPVEVPEIRTQDVPLREPLVTNSRDESHQSNSDDPSEHDVPDFVVGEDMWNNAFREACQSRSIEEREKLANTSDVQKLFESLRKEDENREETSFFQKGVNKVGPVLAHLNFLLNLANPVSIIEPSASSALALAKMVTAIGIAVCGAAQEMHTQIEIFLKNLPRIDFCDAIQSGRPVLPTKRGKQHADIVHEALVPVYKDLLDFFFHCCELLKSRHFALAAVKSRMQDKIATIVTSFSQNLEAVDKAIVVATKDVVNHLAEEDINREVRELLQPEGNKEFELYNSLRIRADDACVWIESDAVFRDWIQIKPGVKHVTLYGNTGSGKTFTVAYVVDYLRSDPHKTIKTLVCSYFCKDDGETNQAKNIFRSLISQLVNAKASLRWDFHEWYRTRKGNIQIDPTQSTNELRSLLVKLISSLRQASYIVIDALDECSDEVREDLDKFFEGIRQRPAQDVADVGEVREQAGLVRVFTSSRYVDQSRILFGTGSIYVPSDDQRDGHIVRHLSERYLQKMPKAIRESIAKEVTARTKGSAIWARMAIQYLQKACSRSTGEASVMTTLSDMPPPQGLAELYANLFEKIVDDVPQNRWILARTLDLLAAAQRQLTLRELSYAVRIEYAPAKKAKTLSEMTEADDHELILDLVRPFVSVEESSSGQTSPDTYVRLVHQSLKQLIMQRPPYEWTALFGTSRTAANLFREAELNGLIMQLCIDYLLLREFDTIELVPDLSVEEFQASIFLEMGEIQPYQGSDRSLLVPDSLDPFEKGFGGFYTYAACYWTTHYEQVTQDYLPDLKHLIALSQPGSMRMKNWLDRMRQPDWRVDLERQSYPGYNPLALIAWFGSEATLEELLNYGFAALGLVEEDLRVKAMKNSIEEAIRYEKFYVVKVLLNHSTTSTIFKDGWGAWLLIKMVQQWRYLESSSLEHWRHLTELTLHKFRDELTNCANEVLLEAAESNCLPLIRRLFELAASDDDLRTALLQRTLDDWGPIGRAGGFGHVEIVRYLCEQPGIELHLHHTDPFGDYIYHFVARGGYPDVLRVLIQHFPDGADQANGSTTPLQVAVNFAEDIEAVKVLLLDGKANVNAGDPYFHPLKCAVWNGRADICRALIVHGNANPWTAVGVSDIGMPFLHEHIRVPVPHVLELEQEVLREICSLIPLTVSALFLDQPGSTF